jgi:simple sugar transport system ATP-binding protein
MSDQPDLLAATGISKRFSGVQALDDVSLAVRPGKVHCLLGDNGAGKSTLIKILSGVTRPDRGQLFVNGEPVTFKTPRDASAAGIATVFQDLATIPLMSIARNFFLGQEPTRGVGPLKRIDWRAARRIASQELKAMGIKLNDIDQNVGTLSGGQRQSIAIARAIHFGARVVILDEPTAALGVREAGAVLRFVAEARGRGVGVIFITHNVAHAQTIGDQFTVLNRGCVRATAEQRGELSREELQDLMAGGEEMDRLADELAQSLALPSVGAPRRDDT